MKKGCAKSHLYLTKSFQENWERRKDHRFFWPILDILWLCFRNYRQKLFLKEHTQCPFQMLKSCGKIFWDRSFEKNRKGWKITYFWPILDHCLAKLANSQAEKIPKNTKAGPFSDSKKACKIFSISHRYVWENWKRSKNHLFFSPRFSLFWTF